MLRCEMCGVTVGNPRKYCPLCQSELVGTIGEERESYPEIPTVYSQFQLFFKILIFFSIVCGSASVIINLFFPQTGLWSLIVLASIFYVWATLFTAVRRKSRISKKILYQFVVVSLLVFAIDRSYGYQGWSVNYVIPAAHVTALLSMTVIAIIQRLRFREYLIHIYITAFLGLIPLVLVLLKWSTVLWPSLTCTVFSLVALLAMAVFRTKESKDELEKRFHV